MRRHGRPSPLLGAARTVDVGRGQRVTVSDDSASFRFFRDSNVELVVELLGGTPINGHRWLF